MGSDIDTDITMEKQFRRNRLFLFGIAAGFSVLGGAEYVTILPTVWRYLQSLGVTEEFWLGFVTSVYSFAAAISGIIGGRLADKYMSHTKTIVVASVAIRIWGNFQYTLGGNITNILGGRLLCGIGNAGETVLLSEVCRTTTRAERTGVLAICNGAFDLGILIGPLLQFILTFFNFHIFSFQVNPINGPGVLIGFLWLIFLFATLLLLRNLAQEVATKDSLEGSQIFITQPNDVNTPGGYSNIDRDFEINDGSDVIRHLNDIEQTNGATYEIYMKEFLTDQFVVLLSLAFIANFCVSGFDTVIPVITQDYLDYGIFENSLIYMVGGLEAVTMFFILAFASPAISDTSLQLIGWFLLLLSQIWFLVFIPMLEAGTLVYRTHFLFGIVVLFLGNPIAFAANASLSSKVLSAKTQGLGQGISRLAIYSGLIYGPTWAGSTVSSSYVFLGVPIAILLINGVMLLFSYRGLRRSESAEHGGRSDLPVSTNIQIAWSPEKGDAKESDSLLSNPYS
ncbi:unnamed protein product [Allacma fusca]|uniref:Major facilitator superfamily (MFS) profile domain-containing protein n=1 Tax=Allacma fusca TaxID=39272 RepID=A0A8J2KRZ5_9HEXA|nr:unnamed protein product [Allacma fusca]